MCRPVIAPALFRSLSPAPLLLIFSSPFTRTSPSRAAATATSLLISPPMAAPPGPNPGLTIASGSGNNVQGAWVFVGADHAVYVGYYDSVAAPDRIAVRKSTDLGLTFSAAVTVSNLVTTGTNGSLNVPAGYRSSAFPQFVASPVTPNLLFSIHPDITVAGGSDSNVFINQS